MRVLRSNSVRACVPNPNEVSKAKFLESFEEEQVVPLYNENGKMVSEQVNRVAIRRPVDDSRLTHENEPADLFSIDNQLKAGVNLQEFKGSFIRPDLAQSSYLGEQAIQLIEERLADNESYKQESLTE